MEKQLFREKSIKRISSPEELSKYLRVTNPSTWLALVGIVLLLLGMIIWASVDTLETKVDAICEVKDSEVILTVAGSDAAKVKDGMIVVINDTEGIISEINYDEYGRAIAKAIVNVKDGKYNGKVVIERIKPISFLFR